MTEISDYSEVMIKVQKMSWSLRSSWPSDGCFVESLVNTIRDKINNL